MLTRAPVEPPYWQARDATLPFARSELPFPISAIGMPNILDAVISYSFPSPRKTSSTHSSPESHPMTRASMAEKSATTKRHPGFGMKAVRINSDKTFGVESYRSSISSNLPCFTSSLASSRSGMWFWGRFWIWTKRPEFPVTHTFPFRLTRK